MSRVLVTGATGFIGTNLVESLLRRGEQVRCLVRASSDTDVLVATGAEISRGTINDVESLRSAVREVDVVYHLAAMTSAFSTSELLRVNRDGTYQLAMACSRASNPPKLVVVSSIAAAGPGRLNRPRLESDPAAPVSQYGVSKRASELAAEAWAHLVPTTIVRPGIVFGPWNRELLPAFRAIKYLRIHAMPTYAPRPLSFIHVSDVVELLLRAAHDGQNIRPHDESARGQGYYFATASEFPNYAEFGRMIGEAMGIRRMVLLSIAEPVSWLVAGMHESANRLTRRLDTFNVDKIREATAGSWICSNEAAERDLGFTTQGTLVERLEETVQWYLEKGWLRGRAPRPIEIPNAPLTPTSKLDVA